MSQNASQHRVSRIPVRELRRRTNEEIRELMDPPDGDDDVAVSHCPSPRYSFRSREVPVIIVVVMKTRIPNFELVALGVTSMGTAHAEHGCWLQSN